jgi:hypothetical protein
VAGDDLEDVAGLDVAAGGLDDLAVGGAGDGRGEGGLGVRRGGRAAGQRAGEVGRDGGEPGFGCGVGVAGRGPVRADGGDKHDLLLERVEHRDDGRPHQHGVGQVERVGVHVREALDKADHVVAEGAEDARGHGGQFVRDRDAGVVDEGRKGREGRLGLRRRRRGRRRRDLGGLPRQRQTRSGFIATKE